MKISLIIPSKNESESLQKVILEAKKFNFINEIIVVVDNHADTSINVIKKFNIKLIIQKNKGYGAAIIEGFKNISNEYGCIFNADYSFDPNYLSKMINKTNNYQFIFGSRYKIGGSSDDDTIITYIGNKIFTFLSKYLLGIMLSDVLYTYVLCHAKSFKKLKLTKHDFRLCIELPYQVKKNNYNYSDISMKERKRFSGQKKVNELRDGYLILLEIINTFFKRIKNE
jgi:glycosyltransferase involved in cell wall biosynthesis